MEVIIMDYFKRIQQEHKRTGAGGWYCFCCNIQSPKAKNQRKNKKYARRYARRIGKYELKINPHDD